MAAITIDPSILKSLLVLASVIEARDPFTGGHIWRTSRYAGILAQAIGLPRGDVFLAQLGGLVHDLGKVAVPDAILTKRARISRDEYEVIKLHPDIGEELVVNHPMAPLVSSAVGEHHLRVDGGGYPERLRDRGPSTIARVVTIADAFDAMTSFRPYRVGNPSERAMRVLREESGAQFDGRMVAEFEAIARRGGLDHVLGHCGDNRLMLSCPECGPIVPTPVDALDGGEIVCPSCIGEFVLHGSGETFELEWSGTRAALYVPRPELDTIDEVLAEAPRRVEVDPDR